MWEGLRNVRSGKMASEADLAAGTTPRLEPNSDEDNSMEENDSDEARAPSATVPASLPSTFSPDLVQKMLEKGLTVKCVEKDLGCTWEGSISELQFHVDNQCRFYTVSCPNGCGATGVLGNSLALHRKLDCPLEVVACKFFAQGCEHRVVRKDMLQHEREFAEGHVALLEQTVESLQKENFQLQMATKRSSSSLPSTPSSSDTTPIAPSIKSEVFVTPLSSSGSQLTSVPNGPVCVIRQDVPSNPVMSLQTRGAVVPNKMSPALIPGIRKPLSPSDEEVCKRSSDFQRNPCPKEICVMRRNNRGSPILRCGSCRRWIHAHCIGIKASKAIRMRKFTCSLCQSES